MTRVYTRCNRLDDALFSARFTDPDDRNDAIQELAGAFKRSGQPEKAQQAQALIQYVRSAPKPRPRPPFPDIYA